MCRNISRSFPNWISKRDFFFGKMLLKKFMHLVYTLRVEEIVFFFFLKSKRNKDDSALD